MKPTKVTPDYTVNLAPYGETVSLPLSNLLRSAAGTCPFCHQKAGILSREHPECRRTHQVGWNEMVRLASGAARSHEFNANSLQASLTEIARRSYGDAIIKTARGLN